MRLSRQDIQVLYCAMCELHTDPGPEAMLAPGGRGLAAEILLERDMAFAAKWVMACRVAFNDFFRTGTLEVKELLDSPVTDTWEPPPKRVA